MSGIQFSKDDNYELGDNRRWNAKQRAAEASVQLRPETSDETVDAPKRGFLGSIVEELGKWHVVETENPAAVAEARRDAEDARLDIEENAERVQRWGERIDTFGSYTEPRDAYGHFMPREMELDSEALRSVIATNAEEPPTDLSGVDLEDESVEPRSPIGFDVDDDYKLTAPRSGFINGNPIRGQPIITFPDGRFQYTYHGDPNAADPEDAKDRIQSGQSHSVEDIALAQTFYKHQGEDSVDKLQGLKGNGRSRSDAAPATRSSRFGSKRRPLGE